MHLLDTNLWLGLAFEVHVHHALAKHWFERQPARSCAFCRLTQMGTLRLASNPSVFGKAALATEKAWEVYHCFLEDERVCYLQEPDGIEEPWQAYTARHAFSPKLWNDAYLAAFARASEVGIATFDGGFKQYSNLSLTLLGH